MKKLFATTVAAIAITSVYGSEIVRQPLVIGGDAQEFRICASKPEHFNRKPVEAASVTAKCDKDNLYFDISMADNDVLSEAEENQTALRSKGDAIQIFLKSEKNTWLWEFQVAPNGKKSCFFHYGAGRMFYPEAGSEFPDFGVTNTFSNGRWDVKIAIPLTIFKEKGFKFTKDEKWTFMIVRHNFSRFFNERENSSYPQSVGNSANPEYFGELIME